MFKRQIFSFALVLLSACSSPEGQEIHKQDYSVSFKDNSLQNAANCVLEYLVSEQIIQKKCQIVGIGKDTIRIRLFGKPKGNWKNQEDRKTAEFALKLLANDFSKICFQNKVVLLQIGQDFRQRKNYLEANSDGSVGFKDYKPQ